MDKVTHFHAVAMPRRPAAAARLPMTGAMLSTAPASPPPPVAPSPMGVVAAPARLAGGVVAASSPTAAGRVRRFLARSLEMAGELAAMGAGAATGAAAGAAMGAAYGLATGLRGSEPAHRSPAQQMLIKSELAGLWLHRKVAEHAPRVLAGLLGGLVGTAVGSTMGAVEGAVWGMVFGLAEARGISRATGLHAAERIGAAPLRPGPPVRVAAIQGDNQIQVLDQVIDASGFLGNLNAKWQASGKSKADFLIALKPNLMMFTHREDPPATYTDPDLVEHLIDRIHALGFSNVRMVEAQNVYGNWFANRTVQNVARVAGFDPAKHHYNIVDLTQEQEDFNYGGRLGNHTVGRTWRDADYRISFAKNKTHVSSMFTLTLKNVYGCLPKQDKALEYHDKREWDKSTVDNLRNFKVDFGFLDGMWSADGTLGFKGTAAPRHTRMIWGGADLIAVDLVAGRMMGLEPREAKLVKLAIQAFGEPGVSYAGNVPPDYVHPGWDNVWPGLKASVPDFLARSAAVRILAEQTPGVLQDLLDVGEETYAGFNAAGMLSNDISGNDHMDPAFPLRPLHEMAPHVLAGVKQNVTDLLQDPKHRQDLKEDLQGVL